MDDTTKRIDGETYNDAKERAYRAHAAEQRMKEEPQYMTEIQQIKEQQARNAMRGGRTAFFGSNKIKELAQRDPSLRKAMLKARRLRQTQGAVA